MAKIKPVPEYTPHIPKVKIYTLIVLVVGAVALGVIIQLRADARRARTGADPVLGEQTQNSTKLLQDELSRAINQDRNPYIRGKTPESVVKEGQDLVASKASEFADLANMQVENVASQAAQNVTDFIYKNSIERVIDSLILSLPEDRKSKYYPEQNYTE